ncbi:chromate transporter-domain-containing protein [Aspergillus pseudonomiae]|uniref:Chromate transporter-domain-containing protein n=1 Tax=Aspergillus pseudonomiae TaxID=1506151 RepID=A0A5N7CSE9_9EURO|nr:chromate transporter-domain-containing protein [Aspergillus pseudonomiae]KAE8397170.1 chromate transporter-domain-containing protein [Aspergillus pseudonomiae]
MLLLTWSRIASSLRALNRTWRSHAGATDPTRAENPLFGRLSEVVRYTWYLGFTSFGGPPVHFQIFHARFVEKEKWVDEQTYQELFAICQGLPGPGSTKMLFCLALLHAGFIPALLAFFLWSLPGAVGMYALSLAVQRIDETLPAPVYALLSGLNASTVGIIALAAVQLAEKAIIDKISRILVIFGACAGLCYSALWYFPVLMVAGGVATALWDGLVYQQILRATNAWKNRNRQPEPEGDAPDSAGLEHMAARNLNRGPGLELLRMRKPETGALPQQLKNAQASEGREEPPSQDHAIRIRVGITIFVLFFKLAASFIAILVSRAKISLPPLALDLFANMYLAGTVIFGGGPVVIPLLRSYVVDPGWVSSRDFLIGLAIIQAFPGPNFNFAVFLGALALRSTSYPTVFGAFLGGLGIFFPGIALAIAIQSFWRVLRKRKYVIDFLRGVNASAVGLVFTAVYRLWEIGYLSPGELDGQSLAKEPWWVTVAAVTYAESAWFKVPPAVAILLGAVLGLCWYGVVSPAW